MNWHNKLGKFTVGELRLRNTQKSFEIYKITHTHALSLSLKKKKKYWLLRSHETQTQTQTQREEDRKTEKRGKKSRGEGI